jgi:hypothetical protein
MAWGLVVSYWSEIFSLGHAAGNSLVCRRNALYKAKNYFTE